MSTTTATILIGRAHQNDSGIIPSHLIFYTENNRPAFIIRSLESGEEIAVVIPTYANAVDDLYLVIVTFILNKMDQALILNSVERDGIDDIFNIEERMELYEKAKSIISEYNIKVVFNLLENCHLLTQIDNIKQYTNDYEVTIPYIKNEYSAWSRTVTFKEFTTLTKLP